MHSPGGRAVVTIISYGLNFACTHNTIADIYMHSSLLGSINHCNNPKQLSYYQYCCLHPYSVISPYNRYLILLQSYLWIIALNYTN